MLFLHELPNSATRSTAIHSLEAFSSAVRMIRCEVLGDCDFPSITVRQKFFLVVQELFVSFRSELVVRAFDDGIHGACFLHHRNHPTPSTRQHRDEATKMDERLALLTAEGVGHHWGGVRQRPQEGSNSDPHKEIARLPLFEARQK